AERQRVAANGAHAVRERHTLRARMAELSAVVEAGIVHRDVASDVAFAWGMTAHLAAVRGLAAAAVTVPAAARSLRTAADAGEAEAAVALAEILLWAGQDAAAPAALAAGRPRRAPRASSGSSGSPISPSRSTRRSRGSRPTRPPRARTSAAPSGRATATKKPCTRLASPGRSAPGTSATPHRRSARAPRA